MKRTIVRGLLAVIVVSVCEPGLVLAQSAPDGGWQTRLARPVQVRHPGRQQRAKAVAVAAASRIEVPPVARVEPAAPSALEATAVKQPPAAAAGEFACPSPSPAYVEAVKRYCTAIGPTASDARLAWQKRAMAEMEQQMAQRVERLDALVAEHKDWLAKRQTFATRVATSLVQVLSRMPAEAAARHVAELDEDTAAALLMRLDPKIAAPLLSEIPAAKAARLTVIIAAAGELTARRGASPPSSDAPMQAARPGTPSANEPGKP